jgi:hypothetical protein
MRNLTQQEMDDIGLDQNSADDGSRVVETDTAELAQIGAGTDCGIGGNTCFAGINERFPGRKVYAEVLELDGQLCVIGMPMMQCNEDEAKTIEEIASNAGGSMRASGKSAMDGFYEFEVE